jgi:UDP-N-acetylmuramate--alanine ligase
MSPSRVVVVFQPHLYSRTAAFAEEFGEALAAADAGLVLDIYEARESAEDFPGVDSALVVTAANAASGREAFAAGGPSASAADAIARLLVEGDICLLLGAGDVGSIAAELVE